MIAAVRRAARRVLFAVALAACASAGALAQPARGDDGLLKVPPLARVVDAAGALGAPAVNELENKLAAFETAHGSQIAIVIVPSTKPEEISDFAFRVGGEWKIGRAGVGDGVLIVVATQDRRAWIAVARALEGAIPDVSARRIVREQMGPFFKEGNFAGGLNAALDAIFRLVEGERLPPPRERSRGPLPNLDGGVNVLLLPLIIVGFIVGRQLKRWLGVPGSLLAGGGTGATAGFLLSSLALGGLAGVVVFILSFLGGSGVGRVLGGRRGDGGGIFIPGGWSGGGGSGGGGWSSGGGGWSSGGGGDFSGGGAGGDW